MAVRDQMGVASRSRLVAVRVSICTEHAKHFVKQTGQKRMSGYG